jgi:hypothetical protein
LPPKPTVDLMRQLLTSIFTLLLTASIALGLDVQTKTEIARRFPRRPSHGRTQGRDKSTSSPAGLADSA